MEHLQTLAIQINAETYSIAVACLPAGFAMYPFEEVDGRYLVINELRMTYDPKRKGAPKLNVGNTWLEERRFNKKYEYDGRRNIKTAFVPVHKVG